MRNLLSNLIGLVTRNWGLKLLALVLAVVLYYSMKPTAGKRWRDTRHDGNFFQSR